jgi:integrase
MADDDIYGNKKHYESFLKNLDHYLNPPDKNNKKDKKRKYWVKNKNNLKYFRELCKKFEAEDNAYIRRLRLFGTLLPVCYVLDIDLSKADRPDIDKVMTYSHQINKTVKSKSDFVKNMRFLWRNLFPERDKKGRIDDTIVPYPVRHLSSKIEKSKDKLRGDKFSLEEFEKLVQCFSDDPRMQCLLTLSFESLSRPQELLFTRIKDVEIHDNYAKIYIAGHGKEGTGFLRCIDSFFYLSKWYNAHPLNKNPNAFLFINIGHVNRHQQLKPASVNKMIRERCALLGIKKPITGYSLKRNGITSMRLQGKSDLDIQHTARWTSTKQLKTYDMSNQEESFMIELVKRGKVKAPDKFKDFQPKIKACVFCGFENGMTESICNQCKRPLDREVIEKEAKDKDERIDTLEKQMRKVLVTVAKNVEKRRQ